MGYSSKDKNPQSESLLPSEPKKPKIIRRKPGQHKFVQHKPYLNAYQVLTGVASLLFFVGAYTLINRKESTTPTNRLSSREVESVYHQVIRAYEERRKDK